MLLPFIITDFLLFALVLGTDSYNFTLNTLVLLFIVNIDNLLMSSISQVRLPEIA